MVLSQPEVREWFPTVDPKLTVERWLEQFNLGLSTMG